jgi:hypothetical protein
MSVVRGIGDKNLQKAVAKLFKADFLFPSLKADGTVPISPSVFVADHLPASRKRGRA